MQPSPLIATIFLCAVLGGHGQEILPSPEVRPARAVPEPADGTTPSPPKEENPSGKKPANPAANRPAPPPAGPALATPASAMNAAALLPIGVPSYDVRMPEFDEERLLSRMRVRELIRINEDQLDLRQMELERYLPTGGLDYVVSVERGFYELGTGRLVSSSPTRLRGKAIDLHGEGCVYSKDVEVIKILGKVTSYIYVEKGQIEPKPVADPAPAPEAPKAAPDAP